MSGDIFSGRRHSSLSGDGAAAKRIVGPTLVRVGRGRDVPNRRRHDRLPRDGSPLVVSGGVSRNDGKHGATAPWPRRLASSEGHTAATQSSKSKIVVHHATSCSMRRRIASDGQSRTGASRLEPFSDDGGIGVAVLQLGGRGPWQVRPERQPPPSSAEWSWCEGESVDGSDSTRLPWRHAVTRTPRRVVLRQASPAGVTISLPDAPVSRA
jgi:hypothetical protein